MRVFVTGVTGQMGHDMMLELVVAWFKPLLTWKDALGRYLTEIGEIA